MKKNILCIVLVMLIWNFHLSFADGEYNGLQFSVFRNENMEKEAKIIGYTGSASMLTIPDVLSDSEEIYPVTVIGNSAFKSNNTIQFINFPNTIKSIEKEAFSGCPLLEQVYIPEGVTTIGISAFYQCSSLKEVYLPDSLNSIGGRAFGNCNSLTSIEIPANIQKVDYVVGSHYSPPNYVNTCDGPFNGCENLKNISFRNGIEKIPEYLFDSTTGLTSIVIPDTVTEIAEYAFQDCKNLKYVEFSQNLSVIGPSAFYNCIRLNNINLPNNLKEINNNAFHGCKDLSEISIPPSVKAIGSSTFGDCSSLRNVDFHLGLELIDDYAFFNCNNISSIVMPDSVTYVGSSAFENCSKLSSVRLSQGLTKISRQLFSGDPMLKEIQLPWRVTRIDEYAFSSNGTNLTDITILSKVQSIGTYRNSLGNIVDADIFTDPSKVTIHGITGSYAETYANEKGITFVPLGDVPVTAVYANPNPLTLDGIGNDYAQTIVLTIEPMDFTGDVIWETTKSGAEVINIASDGSGLITGKKNGTAIVKITAGDMILQVPVTVQQLVTDISISGALDQISVGERVQMTATVYPDTANNKDVLWSSSDPEVLFVNENGLVTALKKGHATITAKAADAGGKYVTHTIQVPNKLYRVFGTNGFECTHNYENNCTDIWELKMNGATYIDLTFDDRTNFEEEYDYLLIKDETGKLISDGNEGYTGIELASKTVHIDGSLVRLQLNTGISGTDWGFKVVNISSDGDIGGTDMVLPSSLTVITSEAFRNGIFTSVLIPADVQFIDELAFADCKHLKDVYILSNNVSISETAFSGLTDTVFFASKGSPIDTFAETHGFIFVEN